MDRLKKLSPTPATEASEEAMMHRVRETSSEPPPPFATDVDLCAAAAGGDEIARRLYISRLLVSVRRTMSYLAKSSDQVDDLTQIALVRALDAASAFRGECPLEQWAGKIAARVALTELRKLERRSRLMFFLPRPTLVSEASPEALTSEAQVRRRLASLMAKLPVAQRTAIVLRHVEGYSLAEIADITGSPLNTVRERLRVAKNRLVQLIGNDPSLRAYAQKRVQ